MLLISLQQKVSKRYPKLNDETRERSARAIKVFFSLCRHHQKILKMYQEKENHVLETNFFFHSMLSFPSTRD